MKTLSSLQDKSTRIILNFIKPQRQGNVNLFCIFYFSIYPLRDKGVRQKGYGRQKSRIKWKEIEKLSHHKRVETKEVQLWNKAVGLNWKTTAGQSPSPQGTVRRGAQRAGAQNHYGGKILSHAGKGACHKNPPAGGRLCPLLCRAGAGNPRPIPMGMRPRNSTPRRLAPPARCCCKTRYFMKHWNSSYTAAPGTGWSTPRVMGRLGISAPTGRWRNTPSCAFYRTREEKTPLPPVFPWR